MRRIMVILVVLSALLLAACVSYPIEIEKHTKNIIVWDESIPKEESVLLFFPWAITVTSYNGINVKWEKSAVYLPSGEIQLTLDMYDNVYAKFNRNLLFERTLMAGERYSLFPTLEHGIPILILQDLNEKKEWEDQIIHYFPRQPVTILPGESKKQRLPGEATVVFGWGIYVVYCNEQFVYDEYYPKDYHVWQLNKETLPAGATTVNFDVYFVDHKINLNVITAFQNLEFTYDFEAGKTYTVAVDSKLLNPFETEYFVAIYNFDSSTGKAGTERQIVKSWKFAEFNKPSGRFTWFSPATGEPIKEPEK